MREIRFGITLLTEQKRGEVAKAQQQKKMVENLKEKRYRQWEQESRLEETKSLDEIATLRRTKK